MTSTNKSHGMLPPSVTRLTTAAPAILPVHVASSSSQPTPAVASSSSQQLGNPSQRQNDYWESVWLKFRDRKTTQWRLLNTLVLLAAGTAKAISDFRNESVISNSWDVFASIVWALM